MAIAHYLAMTAAEMTVAPLSRYTAWMACHFSPYSTGLRNLPQQLPEGCLLILNDRIPIHGHDPQRICSELEDTVQKFHCSGILLDFQNRDVPETDALAGFLVEKLSCPLGISPGYQKDGAAVFLPAVPPDTPLQDYLAPWKGKRVWLETALEGMDISLTKNGAQIVSMQEHSFPSSFSDEALHCHYCMEESHDSITFHLWRSAEDLSALMEEAEILGVEMGVGLFQELGNPASVQEDE